MSLKVLPNVLCLQLKVLLHNQLTQRFDGQQAKIDDHVRLPITLDMTPYTTHHINHEFQDKRDCTYDLFAVIAHIGVNIHKGHYVNYAKFNGEWFAFNDHIVEWVSEDHILRQKAYVPSYLVTLGIYAFTLNIVLSTNMMRL
jgi:ubiquitin C-terminal hydrolase